MTAEIHALICPMSCSFAGGSQTEFFPLCSMSGHPDGLSGAFALSYHITAGHHTCSAWLTCCRKGAALLHHNGALSVPGACLTAPTRRRGNRACTMPRHSLMGSTCAMGVRATCGATCWS